MLPSMKPVLLEVEVYITKSSLTEITGVVNSIAPNILSILLSIMLKSIEGLELVEKLFKFKIRFA